MGAKNEFIATLVIAVIAVLFIIGGFATFSGLAVYDAPLMIKLSDSKYSHGDILDGYVILDVPSVTPNAALVLYLDGESQGSVGLLSHMESENLKHTMDEKQGVKLLLLKEPVRLHLSDFVDLEALAEGHHNLMVRLTTSDALATADFVLTAE